MSLTSQEKKRRFSERQREKGYTQISFWVPETEVARIHSYVKGVKDEYIRRNAEGGESNSGDNR